MSKSGWSDSPSSCPQNAALLALHAGSDAPLDEAAALRRHLTGCPDCRQVLAEFRATRDWLRASHPPPVDADLLAELRQRVARRLSRERPLPWLAALAGRAWSSWRSGWHSLGWQPLRGAGVAALLLVGALGALSGLNRRHAEPGAWSSSSAAAWSLLPETAGESLDSLDESEESLAETEEGDSERSDPLADPDPTVDDLTPLPSGLRIEMHTPDPNVRIIWFAANPGPPGRSAGLGWNSTGGR
jgi:hypothetical protein